MNYRLCGCLILGALVLMVTGPISCPAYAQEANQEWEGAYIGIHEGYGWGEADTFVNPLPSAAIFVNLAPTTIDPNPIGIFGGGQVGYNWQRKAFVLGVETDFSGTGMSGTRELSPIIQNNGTPFPGPGNIRVHEDTDWFGTLRLRMGYAPISRLLVYMTGGMAYGRVNYSANTDFRTGGTEQYPKSSSVIKVGWTAGAGAEFALNSKWSLKLEYLYYDLGSESDIANPVLVLPPYQIGYKWETKAHTVNVGLNYRF